MKLRKCVYENCPVSFAYGEWIVRPGIEIPDTVLEHEHTTVGGQLFPAETETPQELHDEVQSKG